MGAEVPQPIWVAMRSALRQAGLERTLLQRRGAPVTWLRRRQSRTNELEAPDAGFGRGEKATLDLGSCIVLGTLGFGLQFGRWPVWSALVAVGGYLTWVVIYSEATVQARRRRPFPRHPASSVPGSEDPTSSPTKEQVTA